MVTFYSYKGGVGRSMAVANTAVLLAQKGRRVLVVDWDLEAPGLERYFATFAAEAGGAGLLPMLLAARSGDDPDVVRFARTLQVPDGVPLSFLSSGREVDPNGYVATLQRFDWADFFRSGGGDFLERLRQRWKAEFDFVL